MDSPELSESLLVAALLRSRILRLDARKGLTLKRDCLERLAKEMMRKLSGSRGDGSGVGDGTGVDRGLGSPFGGVRGTRVWDSAGSDVALVSGVACGVGFGLGAGAGVGVGLGAGAGLGEGAGGLVSTVKETELLASEPSVLALPAVSVKVPLGTEITPLAVLLLLGVKVAE